jgi:hypothetical protein
MLVQDFYRGLVTKQEVYNFVIEQLRIQGQPSTNSKGQCLYRSGCLKCGIGFLIPDEHYNTDMEEADPKVWDFFRALAPEEGEESLNASQYFLIAMQVRLHDCWSCWSCREGGAELGLELTLEATAELFCEHAGLVYSPPA